MTRAGRKEDGDCNSAQAGRCETVCQGKILGQGPKKPGW